MAISETLRNAVNEKDITAIRSCFYTIILSDPGFKTNRFDEALNYVKASNVDNVIVAHDGEKLLPEDDWNDEYFDLLASKLQDNFSIERIEQLKKVAKYTSSGTRKDTNTISNNNIQNNKNNYQTFRRCGFSQNNNSKKNNSSSNTIKTPHKTKGKNHAMLGAMGVGIITFLVLKHIFKGGK